jgi:hypothetical protein
MIAKPSIGNQAIVAVAPPIGDAERAVVAAQWGIVEPVFADPPACEEYEPGSWGPAQVDALIGADGPWPNPQPSAAG